MAVAPKLRFEVLKKHNFTCVYCGRKAGPDVKLNVDHATSIKEGGTDEPSNLVCACWECNIGKGAGSVTVGPGGVPKPTLTPELRRIVIAIREVQAAANALADVAGQAPPLVHSVSRAISHLCPLLDDAEVRNLSGRIASGANESLEAVVELNNYLVTALSIEMGVGRDDEDE